MASLIGLGFATPKYAARQDQFAAHALATSPNTEQEGRVLANLYARSGVDRRHSVLIESIDEDKEPHSSFFNPSDDEQPEGPTTGERMKVYAATAGDIAVRAARDAIFESDISPARITHLVTITCSGFYSPGVDVQIIQELGLPATTSRTNVGFMGCHAALNGLRVARGYCEADPSACVLMVAIELCSIHYQYHLTVERIVSNSLFADGSAAAVITGDPARSGARIADNFSCIVPDTKDAMGWRIGDNGFEMTLSKDVPQLIHENAREPISDWLARHGLTIDAIESWAIHAGGPRIIDSVGKALGLPPTALVASRQTLADYGNMSSPTVMFVLDRLRRESDAPYPCVMIGFGPGLAVEAALVM